jgi:L-arabinonolactonase
MTASKSEASTGMRMDTIGGDIRTLLGEGPVWDVESQRLFWIDSLGRRVFSATEHGSEVRTWEVPGPIGSLAVRADGSGAVVALEKGFHHLDFATGDVDLIVDPEPDLDQNRLNDGKVDARGRFVVGSMNMLEDGPTGSIFVLDTDFSHRTLDTGITVSNGPCWSNDGKTFYFTDSWSGSISAYDYDADTAAITNKRRFAPVDTSGGGASDGSTVDSQGYLWNALVYDGKIVRYTPDGAVDRIIDMPVKKVTSVMFGGPNLDKLFVTSMSRPPLPHLPEDSSPDAGTVFVLTGLGVTGVPEHRFGV